MAAIPEEIKVKLTVDTTELDEAIEKIEKYISLQKQSVFYLYQ